MSRTWYGNLQNRLEENKQLVDKIEIGTGMTEYSYSDRHAYEVIEVKDQKHVVVRLLDHKHVGDVAMDNSWELVSNEDNPSYSMTKRGKYWYYTRTVTVDELEEIEKDVDARIWFALNGFDADVIRAKGKQTKYSRANVTFGVASYYYDYEF